VRRAAAVVALSLIIGVTRWHLVLPPRSAYAEGGSRRLAPLPPAAFVEGVVGHPQERNLSCESRSATDLAAFWGAAFSEGDFLRRLPKSDNPHRGFVGDVDMPPGSMPPAGYGVYVEPVAASLRSFGLDAQARRKWSLDGLLAELAAGRPTIVWATYDMQQPGLETWVSSDGVTSVVVMWQHTFVAVGYDEGGLTLVDAYDGGTKFFSYEAFDPAWAQLGRMAVVVRGPSALPGGRVWRVMEGDRHPWLVVDGRWMTGPE
jgi:uncharacterized protein YvpB